MGLTSLPRGITAANCGNLFGEISFWVDEPLYPARPALEMAAVAI
jgi:hypothetical protein